MVARGIRGQSVASEEFGVTLFGGFDDRIVRVDVFTGRISTVDTAGRTVLYPWDDSHFVCIEEALGRPSKTRLSLRRYSEPSDVVSADGEWSSSRRLIPGHFPTVFVVESGHLHTMDDQMAIAPDVAVGFVPGVYTTEVPVVVDGAWTGGDGTVIAGIGVGRDSTVFFATAEGLTVTQDGKTETLIRIEKGWRPARIEHDPVRRRIAVVSWNRWRSLGGPTSDIDVFAEDGTKVGTGQAKALVERMALEATGVMAMDIEGKSAFVDLELSAG